MNILGVGAPELILILIIALIVAGPQRMLRWAYYMGRATAKLRGIWAELMTVVQREVDAAGLDIEVPKNIPTRQDVGRIIEKAAKPYIEPMEQAVNEVKKTGADVRQTVQDGKREVSSLAADARRKPITPANGKVKSAPQNDTPETPNYGAWSGTGGASPTNDEQQD